MEVHHPHHVHHKKKWKEYFLEFFMLFFAVSLGFFAENLREEYIISHKLHANYEALKLDLQQDIKKIHEIKDSTVPYEGNMIRLKYLLFRLHKKELSWDQFADSIKLKGRLPTYMTLFMNNMTFKNMQSSGLIGHVPTGELKKHLSYYYEVMFKRLEDNNKLFDALGADFFGKHLPSQRLVEDLDEERSGRLLSSYDHQFSGPKEYKDFIFSLPLFRKQLESDEFLFQLNQYSSRYYNYHSILEEINEKAEALLKELEEEK